MRRPKANLGQTTTLGNSERKGRIGLDCLSVNPKRARMGSLLVLDCTLYILEYMWAARGYPYVLYALGRFWKFNSHRTRNVWSLRGSELSNMLGSQTLVFPEESRSVVAKATLVSACTACTNRSRGSRVGVWLEGAGELGSGILGGPGDGGLLSPPPPPPLIQLACT